MIYSKEAMVNKYKRLSDDYQIAIDEFIEFKRTDFAQKNNSIQIFTLFHLLFAKNAKEILNETMNSVINGFVTMDVYMRIKKLVNKCREEHYDINDTYNRIMQHDDKNYYVFEAKLMRFRELCDEVEYLDETLEEIKSMATNSKMVFNNSSNIQIMQNADNSCMTMNVERNEVLELDQIEKIIAIFRDSIKESDLDEEINNEIIGHMDIIESQLSSENPIMTVIKEALKSIRNIAEGTTGSLFAALLIKTVSVLNFWDSY